MHGILGCEKQTCQVCIFGITHDRVLNCLVPKAQGVLTRKGSSETLLGLSFTFDIPATRKVYLDPNLPSNMGSNIRGHTSGRWFRSFPIGGARDPRRGVQRAEGWAIYIHRLVSLGTNPRVFRKGIQTGCLDLVPFGTLEASLAEVSVPSTLGVLVIGFGSSLIKSFACAVNCAKRTPRFCVSSKANAIDLWLLWVDSTSGFMEARLSLEGPGKYQR